MSDTTIPSILDNAPFQELAQTYDLNDPHTGDLLYKVSCVKEADAIKAVESAAKAFKTWKDTSATSRRAIFLNASRLLEERKEEFIKIATTETTANGFWGAVDHQLAWNIVSETAALATALKGEIAPSEDGQRAYIERVPYGVVFGIAPWNAPLTLGVRCFANAIMAGNAVVWKTSEYSPKIHHFATQLFIDAGLPSGVLNMIHVAPADSPKVCEAIIAHKAVRKINFTGSTFVGRKLAEVAGRYLKPCCMELGGKAPVIVLKDANLEAAANSVMFGGLSHSGQICMASDRLIVHEDIADEFTKILSSHHASRKAAGAMDANNPMQYRGLFSQRSADRVNDLIQDALNKGAKIIIGKQESEKNVIQPVVLDGINKEMKIDQDEIFGPAMTFTKFKTAEEAIEKANSSDYGLAASVYGSNEAECWNIAKQIESGQVHINGSTVHDSQTVPHGGLKDSGYGRFNGIEGLREFSTTKTITINLPHGQYPM